MISKNRDAERILQDYNRLSEENSFYINNPHTDARNGISIDGKNRDGTISAYTTDPETNTLKLVKFKKKPLKI